MFRILSLCTALALLSAIPALAQEKATKPKKPKVNISVSPRMAQAPLPGYERVMRLFIVVEDSDEKHWCPEIRVEWDDGDATSREADCVPFESAPPEEVERKSYPDTGSLTHSYAIPGTYNIKVQFLRNGKVFLSKTVEFTIVGA